MEEVKPTAWRAVRLFFAFTWRLVVYTGVGVIAGGVFLGLAFSFIRLDAGTQQIILAIATYIIGLPAMFLAAQHCLSRKIGDFRIMLVKAE